MIAPGGCPRQPPRGPVFRCLMCADRRSRRLEDSACSAGSRRAYMIQLIAALQPLVIGAVLIWSARIKLFSRHAASNASRSALVSLIGQERALPTYRLLGGIELAIGILLVLPPTLAVEAAAATVLAAGFTGYLYYAHTRTPDASCGCMSARRTPVSWRSFLRAGFLVAAGLIATMVTADLPRALAAHPMAGAG